MQSLTLLIVFNFGVGEQRFFSKIYFAYLIWEQERQNKTRFRTRFDLFLC